MTAATPAREKYDEVSGLTQTTVDGEGEVQAAGKGTNAPWPWMDRHMKGSAVSLLFLLAFLTTMSLAGPEC